MPPANNLNAECEVLRQRFKLPAVGLAQVSVAGVEAIGVAGERQRGSRVAVTENDHWHLGSVTKSMTATLMARLVERGLFEWDAPLVPMLTEMGFEVHPDFAGLTLRHLLNHRSGIPYDNSIPKEPSATPMIEQRIALTQQALATPPETRPGAAFAYSGTGYTAAACLAEAVTGAVWEDLMRTELFEPLGMMSAGFGPPGGKSGDDAAKQPWGHTKGFWNLNAMRPDYNADIPVVIGPAGNAHMSLPDFGRYIAFHLSRGESAPGLLTEDTFDTLHTPLPGEDYALGWRIAPAEATGIGKALIWHEGSNEYWYAVAILVPEDGLALALVSNTFPDEEILVALDEIYNNWITQA